MVGWQGFRTSSTGFPARLAVNLVSSALRTTKEAMNDKQRRINQRKHTAKRAKERYGIELTSSAHKFIVSCILKSSTGTAKFKDIPVLWRHLKKQSNTRSSYSVRWGNARLVVVYDKLRQSLRTVLPENTIDKEDPYNEISRRALEEQIEQQPTEPRSRPDGQGWNKLKKDLDHK